LSQEHLDDLLEQLQEREKQLQSKDRLKKQQEKGKLSVRERIELLVDKGSFREIGAFRQPQGSYYKNGNVRQIDGDGVVVGYATVHERPIILYAQDFTQVGGSLGKAHAEKIVQGIELALQSKCPVVGLLDSGGARIQEGVAALEGYAEIFQKHVQASGIIPQISLLLGPCAGGASYSPALTDFVFMVEGISSMFITGPRVIEKVTGEKPSLDELGGTAIHCAQSGVAHGAFTDERTCFSSVRKLLQMLPPYFESKQHLLPQNDSKHRLNEGLRTLVPDSANKPYDMKEVIAEIFDNGSFFELHQEYAKNVVVGFAVLHDQVVGVVANQTQQMAGCLDIDASDKIARFVRFCDAFRISLINLVDTPGYLPGVEQEHQGIVRHGAKVLYAYAEATVPKIALVLRKAFGGAYIAMAGKSLGYDFTFAWPLAQIAVMGAEQAVEVLYAKQLAVAEHPEELFEEKVQEYEQTIMHPFAAAEQGYIDRIIRPEQTRVELIRALELLRGKEVVGRRKRHGNMPV